MLEQSDTEQEKKEISNKAYNDYMAGQAGISATEKSMVERLGLTGGSQHQKVAWIIQRNR